jgi:hypothetical protein
MRRPAVTQGVEQPLARRVGDVELRHLELVAGTGTDRPSRIA